MHIANDIVPQQEEGSSSDTVATRRLSDVNEARSFFATVRERLLNVNEWGSIAGPASAEFQLCDENGHEVHRTVKQHDHFRIDVPGPGSDTGDGFDWVKVESIDEKRDKDLEALAITVRPASNPNNLNEDVAHFFSDAATSSFIVERKANEVSAGVFGRNESPNKDAEKLVDKARNTAMAIAAVTVFSKIQWKGLVNGLLK